MARRPRPTKTEIRANGYNEDVTARQRTSKRYVGAGSEAGKGKVYCHQSPLHYESVVDSGVCDEEVEIDIKRVVNAEGDGWICETNSWIARLGQPTGKAEDGWFGFSGRSNKDQTFWFRLIGLYYYHKPTDTRERIFDVSYDRVNLTKQSTTAVVGPNGEELTLDCRVDWAGLWTEAGGAEVSLRWFISPTRLKEEVVLNQAAQDWITANKPPSTKPDETWMCCAYEVDDSQVPKIRKGLVEVDRESDFDNEDDEIINGATDLDQLLYLLPIEDAYIEGVDHEGQAGRANRVKLRTAFMKRSGTRLMVVGAPVLDIKALPDGNLVFDPTIEEQVGSGADDVGSTPSSFEPWGDELWPGIFSGNPDCATVRFTNVGVPAGATINSSQLEVWKLSTYGTPNNCSIYGEDVDDSAPLNSGHHAYSNFTRATARLTGQNFGTLPNGWNSFDVTAISTEIHGRGGWAENNAISFALGDQQTGNGQMEMNAYEDNASRAARYIVDFTSGATPVGITLDERWNIITAIAKSLDERWNILSSVAAQLDERWLIHAAIAKTLDERWGISATAAKTLQEQWNILEGVAKPLDERWEILGAVVAKPLDERWSIENAVAKALDERWNIESVIGKALDERWAIVQAVNKPLDERWSIESFVGKALDERWDIQSALVSVNKALDERWNVEGAVSAVGLTLQEQWHVLESASKALDEQWTILDAVGKQLDERWNLLAPVGKAIDERWNIVSSIANVGKSLDERWSTISATGKQLDERWNVLVAQAKQIDERWAIVAAAAKTLQEQWDVDSALLPIAKGLDERWNLQSAILQVGASLQEGWAIVQTAGKSLAEQWAIVAAAAKQIEERWNIAGTQYAGMTAAAFPNENRFAAFANETRFAPYPPQAGAKNADS